MADTSITATLLRRQLKEALKTVESGKGRILITRHNKVVAALVSGVDLMTLKLDGRGAAVVSVAPAVEEELEVVPPLTEAESAGKLVPATNTEVNLISEL